MEFYYAETCADVCPIVESLLKEGDVITNGGTMTMGECGLKELLESPKYKYLDRAKVDTPEEVIELYRKNCNGKIWNRWYETIIWEWCSLFETILIQKQTKFQDRKENKNEN